MSESGGRRHAFARILKRYPFSQYAIRALAKGMAARFTAGVVGVVLDGQGRLLVVEHLFHPRRPWGLPGGWLESRESPADGLAREIYEETGLDIEVIRPLVVRLSQYDRRHLDISYLCLAKGEVASLSRELLSSEWVYPDKLPPMIDFHRAAVDAYQAEPLIEETMT